MKQFIKISLFILLISAFFSILAFANTLTVAVGDNAEPFKGDGTIEKPYSYLIDGESRVVWKHLVTIKQSGDIETYECYEKNDINKRLLYSYMFNPKNLKETPDGPYYLGLRKYGKDKTEGLPEYKNSLYFSLANKREFPGEVEVCLDVSDTFNDGENLTLMYYGGYDSTVIHGGAPTVMEDEILDVDVSSTVGKNIIVENGYAQFSVRNGGNFVLATKVLDFSSLEAGDVMHYDSTKVLGTLDGLFPNNKIAEIIAKQIGCEVTDSVTQGDLDTINTLYLADLNLNNIDEISRACFFKLENLDLSGNDLENVSKLSMPHLKMLNVSNNNINSLAFISGLKELKIIDASSNKIVNLPDLNEFSEMLSLDLHENNLKILPPFEQTKLRYLDISGNSNLEIKGDLEKIESVVSDKISKANSKSKNLKTKINYKVIAGIGLLIVLIVTFVSGLIFTKKRKDGENHYEK